MDFIASNYVRDSNYLSDYSIWVANNDGTDETLGELLRLQRQYNHLHVVDNYFNYGL